ncbi:DUF3558 family protein [Gordonia sp. PS3]|uniref:Putative RNA-binding protein n=1 Tax=Gordonia sihwensis NBRC 108236 TaxID=1223544 RepID=L7LDM8_9ACTN|nr:MULTISPECIES: DUF3558 family protein [Gordonia]AUH69946.1 RNA-binding S4 domain-containing protein [Gordonia sp. YC-JH1]WFN93377.1 DUF3558 family protein [Gordonia sihwensis]GAC59240.1 putative RNA-binding protein [Gordonia sihwensis NBRC 108236]
MATRIDSWIWAIRLTKTRSAAGAACRAGHVQLNGATAKPAAPVSIGDRVTVRLNGRERIVEVTRLISKRVSAPAAAECYIDHSPPPPPREVLASLPRRDRGSGRPTKRERRQLDRFRSEIMLVTLAALAALLLAGCSGGGSDSADVSETPKAGTGPQFARCGGLTTDDVVRMSGMAGLRLAIDNPSTCEWRADAQRNGSVSFNWYRGSPIGRERGTEQLSRDTTQDYEIDGNPGFLAHTAGICEIGVAWDADFIEISLASPISPGAGPTIAEDQLCGAAKSITEKVVKGAA